MELTKNTFLNLTSKPISIYTDDTKSKIVTLKPSCLFGKNGIEVSVKENIHFTHTINGVQCFPPPRFGLKDLDPKLVAEIEHGTVVVVLKIVFDLIKEIGVENYFCGRDDILIAYPSRIKPLCDYVNGVPFVSHRLYIEKNS